jgi:uncharacterized protein involved in exopolysaccharide biosynthesis
VNHMNGGVQAIEFAGYVAARWRVLLIAALCAAALAGIAGFVLPRRYTATASLMIDPPAGMDPRSATNLSPVYLESLKTYEHLASSDSLFLEALNCLGIRGKTSGRTIEALKRSVLKTSKPLNTRIVEIEATLEDPAQAQRLAQYLAERTVALSAAIDSESAAGTAKEAQGNFDRAEKRLNAAIKASEEFGPAGLADDLYSTAELKYGVDRDLRDARSELAGSVVPDDGDKTASLHGRIAELEKQARDLDLALQSKEHSSVRREELDADVKSSRLNFDAARAKLDDLNASAAFRGERLHVLDPGIVPQRPSFPNTPLNVVAALLISLAASVCWLALRFGYERTMILHAAREPDHSLFHV